MYKVTFRQKKQFKQIAEKYDLNFLALFGSRAAGHTHSKSDFDIAYSPKKTLDYGTEYDLTLDLMRVLKSPDVEVVSAKSLQPYLLYNIAFRSQMLCELTPHSFASFQVYAFKQYVEAKPLFQMIRNYNQSYANR